MNLTKSDIIQKISTETSLTQKQATQTVEAVLETVKRTPASGEDVMIRGFGKFCVKEKHERKGTDPTTGSEITLPAKKVVTFRYSGRLRERVNGLEST